MTIFASGNGWAHSSFTGERGVEMPTLAMRDKQRNEIRQTNSFAQRIARELEAEEKVHGK